MTRRLAVLVVGLAMAAVGACGGGDEEAAPSAEDVAAGAKLYADNCASCHGAEGNGGTGPVLRAKQFLENAGDEQLQTQIAGGIQGTAMPGWSKANGGPFEDEKIEQIVAYLRSLEAGAPDVPDRRKPVTP